MSGCIMQGRCNICGKEDVQLHRHYFHYPVKCECHSPNHFEIIECCADCTPVEPMETKVYLKTEELKNPVQLAMPVLVDALKKDKTPGSYYYSWQSNIACAIMDGSNISHEDANNIAIKFLDNLIR